MERPLELKKPSLVENISEDSPAQGLPSRHLHQLPESGLTTKAYSCGEWVDDLLAGFSAYYLTSLPVLLGVLFTVE